MNALESSRTENQAQDNLRSIAGFLAERQY
jgi:hypothetical protein